jgi:hypothetical protein
VGEDFARVHVFQQAEQGLARIRQYLVRGERPIVLISTQAEVDPLSGIHGLGDFETRLKMQAAGIQVFGLREEAQEGASPSTPPPALDAVLDRPGLPELRGELGGELREGARRLASALARAIDGEAGEPATPAADGGDATASSEMRELRSTMARLRDASSRGAILPVAFEFASELFARAAMLLVRGERLAVVKGCGVPALDAAPGEARLTLSAGDLGKGWIATALATRACVEAAPETTADLQLIEHLGLTAPARAFVGPIECGGDVVALVYGDGGPAPAELPDTSALEVVLHHAGLALDRAALERALQETEPAPR